MDRRTLPRLLPLLLALLLTLSACGGAKDAQPTPDVTPAPTAEPTPAPTPEPTPIPAEKVNPLTGLEIPGSGTAVQRPVAVMLNNIKVALPQRGNSQADIIYEVLAEGGITRMLGVYQTMEGVGEVGSIRSSRPYYLDLALGLDAIYIHAGGSEDAYADIKSWGVTALDYVRSTKYNAIFWRDKERVKSKGYEHSVFTSGDAITQHFPEFSFRKDHEDGYSLPYTYAADGAPANGDAALTIQVPFSNYKTGVFRYDASTGKYLVEEYNAPLVDENNGQQVAVTNVLVLQASCRAIDDYGRMRVDLGGYSGSGWFACGGKIIPITWSKADRNSPLVYAAADGTPLTLGQGNSYVNIIPKSNSITVE